MRKGITLSQHRIGIEISPLLRLGSGCADLALSRNGHASCSAVRESSAELRKRSIARKRQVKGAVFHLLKGQDAFVAQNYLFLARQTAIQKYLISSLVGTTGRLLRRPGLETSRELAKRLFKHAEHRLAAQSDKDSLEQLEPGLAYPPSHSGILG